MGCCCSLPVPIVWASHDVGGYDAGEQFEVVKVDSETHAHWDAAVEVLAGPSAAPRARRLTRSSPGSTVAPRSSGRCPRRRRSFAPGGSSGTCRCVRTSASTSAACTHWSRRHRAR